MGDLTNLMSNIDKSGRGVCVQASTLGSLEALLEFLRTSKIPVSQSLQNLKFHFRYALLIDSCWFFFTGWKTM
jgi:hypothetical protein